MEKEVNTARLSSNQQHVWRWSSKKKDNPEGIDEWKYSTRRKVMDQMEADAKQRSKIDWLRVVGDSNNRFFSEKRKLNRDQPTTHSWIGLIVMALPHIPQSCTWCQGCGVLWKYTRSLQCDEVDEWISIPSLFQLFILKEVVVIHTEDRRTIEATKHPNTYRRWSMYGWQKVEPAGDSIGKPLRTFIDLYGKKGTSAWLGKEQDQWKWWINSSQKALMSVSEQRNSKRTWGSRGTVKVNWSHEE